MAAVATGLAAWQFAAARAAKLALSAAKTSHENELRDVALDGRLSALEKIITSGALAPPQVVPQVAPPAVEVPVPSAPPPVEAAEPTVEPMTEAEVLECQANWANAIKSISKTYLDGGDFVGAAGKAAGELYGYGKTDVLFKPTKAAEVPFRPTGADAMSYFVGAKNVEEGAIAEDGGFAINGGKGWSDVVFTNHKIEVIGPVAIAMGSYVFTCATTAAKAKVEYTFGYRRNDDGKPRIFLHHSSVPYVEAPAPVTAAEVLECQQNWANAIKSISKTYLEGGDFVGEAAKAAGELYGYGKTDVLFKPTKAAAVAFRPKAADAMSYFVGAKNVEEGGIPEDGGFAINGGKGWSDVVFFNHQTSFNGPSAQAMGAYMFTCATTGAQSKVEYTFGYKRNDDGKVRIYLHHSSVPYVEAPAPITEAEVLECQQNWANAIASISKTYLEGGDFVGAAGEAAGQLYGYGKTDVLFKPTKAADVPFRPTAEKAMSYFVGADNVENGIAEDSGFAINGGKGWKKVEFNNHKIDLNGPTAIAMGFYIFTCATTGQEAKVEYTFGYKRNDDGKPRIFLHHSSVPFVETPAAVPEVVNVINTE